MKTVGYFKKHDLEWHVGLTIPFNGHADDKKAVRDAYKAEMTAKGMKQALQFLQRIEVKNDKV